MKQRYIKFLLSLHQVTFHSSHFIPLEDRASQYCLLKTNKQTNKQKNPHRIASLFLTTFLFLISQVDKGEGVNHQFWLILLFKKTEIVNIVFCIQYWLYFCFTPNWDWTSLIFIYWVSVYHLAIICLSFIFYLLTYVSPIYLLYYSVCWWFRTNSLQFKKQILIFNVHT